MAKVSVFDLAPYWVLNAGVLESECLGTEIPLGPYQVRVLEGRQAWSGADLAGNARKYGGRYKQSRLNALERLNDEIAPYGVEVKVVKGKHGKLDLEWFVAGVPAWDWWRAQLHAPGLATREHTRLGKVELQGL